MADAVVTDRLKNTLPEKARFAARLFIGKTALAASAFYLLIQSGCGNIESPNANSPSPKEQTPASAPSKFVFSELGQKPYMGITSPEVDLAVTTKLKEAGIERILVDNDSRMPTDEELKEIEIALSLAPYCPMLAPQLRFTDRGLLSKTTLSLMAEVLTFPVQ